METLQQVLLRMVEQHLERKAKQAANTQNPTTSEAKQDANTQNPTTNDAKPN